MLRSLIPFQAILPLMAASLDLPQIGSNGTHTTQRVRFLYRAQAQGVRVFQQTVKIFDNKEGCMSLSIAQKVLEFVQKHPEEKFTARQIADWIFNAYPAECREKRERSKATVIPIDSDAALVQQIVAEIGSKRPHLEKQDPQFKTTEGRPRRYYYSAKTDEAEVAATENIQKSLNDDGYQYTEHDLYPMLSKFLRSEFSIYSKRIDEKRARNSHGSGGNHWLFPDLIGFENLSREWHTEIKQCVQQISDRRTKLWSFEVKKLINRSNVREAYFQAVSNSSWANIGYLVTAEIQGAEKGRCRQPVDRIRSI